MYIEKAIIRINNINWKNVGKFSSDKDVKLVQEFLRRMANFCQENNFSPQKSFMINIAELLGGDNIIDDSILILLNEESKKKILKPGLSFSIIKFYLLLSVMADRKNNDVNIYLQVYEPIIKLYERGGFFVYRERGMDTNHGIVSLDNWYLHFKDYPAIDISQF